LLKSCIHCDAEFETQSSHKKRVGGKINECADCVEELQTETAIKHLGSIEDEIVKVVSFSSKEDLEAYNEALKSFNKSLKD
jgi:NAD-dependent SIR2 family protein deacetylase